MLELTKDMEVGVKKIDDQHRELISRINDVSKMGVKAVSQEETKKTIDLLDEYVAKHFHDEEELQKQCKYPKYEWHKGQHDFYEKELQKFTNEFASDGHSAKFTVALSRSVIEWIVKHIKTADVEFGKFYNEQKGNK